MSRRPVATVLVVAAHPDDEVLGCGGTIARHAAAGDRVVIVLVADGVESRQAGGADKAARRAAAVAAAAALGAEAPRFLDFADQRLDVMALLDIVQSIEPVVAEVRPTVVYTHHGGDLNLDHRLVHQAVMTACRPVPGSSVRNILAFEVPSSTEWAGPAIGPPFLPNLFVDIAAFVDAKTRALACYGEEMRPFPHPRSPGAVAALATWRGASCGLAAAESFIVLRQIIA
ncbi:MAG: PIG-L family deacetylase [Magnetospirillum sp.]|nr:PIG-L family deacetylase [Magnetospirillum sp.]